MLNARNFSRQLAVAFLASLCGVPMGCTIQTIAEPGGRMDGGDTSDAISSTDALAFQDGGTSDSAPADPRTEAELVSQILAGPFCSKSSTCGGPCGGKVPSFPSTRLFCTASAARACLAAASAITCDDILSDTDVIRNFPAQCWDCLEKPTKYDFYNNWLSVDICRRLSVCGFDCGGVFPGAMYESPLSCSGNMMKSCQSEVRGVACSSIKDKFGFYAVLPSSCKVCLGG